ncbi:DUF2625 domain-containing protein [uncultured Mucilaginibacter sp.]|uniref:DUF2625 domain-containing protein n=1 Tax=uncultured Mucilaginibacter sp. TaxID=797541 RepID=UPI0025D056BC|nr:DUF2625 domain-containing protein [uncultured Mucilaginibacter sp.]
MKTSINSFAQNKLRTITELSADSSGWTAFKKATEIARNKFEILPADREKAKEALYQTQVTTHSIMGAIIYNTGGILFDNGWIRVLGSGNSRLNRSLPAWNKGKSFNDLGEQPKFLLVADDVVGGFFAINGGAFGKDMGQIYYLAPDDLKWEDLKIGYTDFINLCLVGNMDEFYGGLRWAAWKTDLVMVHGDEGFSIYPYLWTKEGKDINSDSRKIVPVQELYDFETNTLEQLHK